MTGTSHTVAINSTPDGDGLTNWGCTCGEHGQDYDLDEAQENAEAHAPGSLTLNDLNLVVDD